MLLLLCLSAALYLLPATGGTSLSPPLHCSPPLLAETNTSPRNRHAAAIRWLASWLLRGRTILPSWVLRNLLLLLLRDDLCRLGLLSISLLNRSSRKLLPCLLLWKLGLLRWSLHLTLLAATGGDIQPPINGLRNGLDFRAQLLFDLVQIESVLVGDQVNCQTKVSKSSRTSNTMQICFTILWEIKIDYDVDRLDIDTTGKQVRADQVSADPVPEVVEDSVAVRLQHFSMRVEARIAEFSDFLC